MAMGLHRLLPRPGQTQSTSSPITNTVSGNDNPFVAWKNDAFQARFSFSTMRFIINTLVFRNKGRAVSDAASAVDLVLPVTSDANMLSYLTNIPLSDKDTGSFQAMLSYGKGDAAAVLKGVADGLGVLANVAALVWLTTDLMQQFSGGYKKANWASVIYDASGIASIVLHYLSKALNNEELENVSFVFAVIGTAVALATAAGDLANALSSSINSGTGDQSHRYKNRSFGGGVPPGGMPPVVPGPYNGQGPITPPINNPIMPEPII